MVSVCILFIENMFGLCIIISWISSIYRGPGFLNIFGGVSERTKLRTRNHPNWWADDIDMIQDSHGGII